MRNRSPLWQAWMGNKQKNQKKTLNPNRFNVWVVLGWDVASSSARRPATLWVEARRLRWETLNPKP